MKKRTVGALAAPWLLTALFSVFVSAQTQYGSFTQLEYHVLDDDRISRIEGFCYGGGYLWAIDSVGVLMKIDPSGSLVSLKDILTTNCQGAICYESGILWVVTSPPNHILPFDTDGNSLGSGIDISGLPAPFNDQIWGAIKDTDGFWLFTFWEPMIFKVDMSGNIVKHFPNSWYNEGYTTIAKQGNKIYKFTWNAPASNNIWDYYEALAIDVDTGYVTDSWEYPNDYPHPIGLSSGDDCFWTLEGIGHVIGIRKLSIPDPSPPPGIPSTAWGDFTIKRWGYPPVYPNEDNGLYGFDYDRNTDTIWLGEHYHSLWGIDDVGDLIFPIIGQWDCGYMNRSEDIATYGSNMWVALRKSLASTTAVCKIEIVNGVVNTLEEWPTGLGRIAGLAADGTHLWVSGRVDYQSTGDPSNTIYKFDLAGNLIAGFTYPETTNYDDLTWHKGGLWAINWPSAVLCEIHKIDPDTGEVLEVHPTGWVNNPSDNIQGVLASNGDSLLTFAALSPTRYSEYYQRGHLRLIEIQLPSDLIRRDDLLGTWSGQGVYYRSSDTGAWNKLASPASQIASGDLDGDGIDDLIGIWPGQGGVWVKYSGSGGWARLSSTADWISSGDMNGDGRHDLIGTWAGQGVFYRDSLTGAWVKIASPATQIAAGKMDDDAIDDLIGIWPSQAGIWIKSSQSGTWARLSSTADWISSGDMNGDEKDDLLGSWTGQGVYYRDSETAAWVKMATPATQIAAGDLDGDGTNDLVGMWPGQGGVWMKQSSNGVWTKLSSVADWIACGKMRAEGSMTAGAETSEAIGIVSEGPPVFGRFEDAWSRGPGSLNFVFSRQENLKPGESKKPGRRADPGPGEAGFKSTEQKNQVPHEQADTAKEKKGQGGSPRKKR